MPSLNFPEDYMKKLLYKMPCGGGLLRGTVIARPNRFVTEAEVNGRRASCYLANPGRLWELIYPGAEILVTPSGGSTDYTALGARTSRGEIVPLHTQKANDLAAALVQAGRIPGHGKARVKRREVAVGDSRFDFLLSESGVDLYMEVKCCTLFAGRGAYFPDAPSARAVHHVRRLLQMSLNGIRTAVLFIVNSDVPEWFAPDWHTDLEFAAALAEAEGKVELIPVSVHWNEDLSVDPEVKRLPLKLKTPCRENRDSGYCLAVIENDGLFWCLLQRSTHLGRDLRRWQRRRTHPQNKTEMLRYEGKLLSVIPFRTVSFNDMEMISVLDIMMDKKMTETDGMWMGVFRNNPVLWQPITEFILKERFIRYDVKFSSE